MIFLHLRINAKNAFSPSKRMGASYHIMPKTVSWAYDHWAFSPPFFKTFYLLDLENPVT